VVLRMKSGTQKMMRMKVTMARIKGEGHPNPISPPNQTPSPNPNPNLLEGEDQLIIAATRSEDGVGYKTHWEGYSFKESMKWKVEVSYAFVYVLVFAD
jgi:hypothetical protein